MSHSDLPLGLHLVRTTDDFTETTVPAGLLRAHRVADGVWGRLLVRAGSVDFVFEDAEHDALHLEAGDTVAIPPGRPHRVVLVGPAIFAVEFHRSTASIPQPGTESTALSGET